MSRFPKTLLQHRITIEPYLGDSAYGPKYGPAVPGVPAFVDEQTKRVAGPNGTQVTSSSQAICALGTNAPALSRITLADGTVTAVINALRRDGGNLGTPDHLELQLQ
ncbi:hypothetical protein [Streptacidiphilus sp. EB103A]|uniref:hypothetical protein n=1 Tax=Streptacidiphilus sp. EB103A TaxID=3156275 RepID=UPI003512D408